MAAPENATLQRLTTAETVTSSESRHADIAALPLVTLGAPGAGGDFELGVELGRGGMGEVVEARQVALERVVAIKRPLGDGQAVPPLLREALAAGRLEHPGIVPVHLLARSADQTPLFIMKRVEGRAWSELHAQRSLEENLETLLRVCDAVDFAHGQHVVHRDIKPANVMLGAFGEVYLVDWGLAVSTRPDPVLPQASDLSIGGTPAYMAPEMAGPGGGVGPWTDVYLLGATLCELLTGKAPHLAVSLSEALAHASSGALPSLEGAPADLAELCQRAMAAAPADRFASVHEFKTALHRSLRQRGTLALHEQAMQRLSLLERGDAPDAPGLFVECRFGFEQVRRQWPDFSPARDGLHRTLVAMAWHELKKGSVVAARGLFGQLDVQPADLQVALATAESLEREKQQRLEAFEAGARESSTEAARERKGLFATGFAVFIALGSWGLQVLMWQRPALLTSRHGAMLMSVFGISSLVYQWMVRRSPDVNQQQRRIAAALGMTWLNSVLLWLIAASWELPFMQTLALYQLVNTVAWSVSAVLAEARARPMAVVFFVSTIITICLPSVALGLNGFVLGLGFWWLGRSLRRDA